MTSLTERLATCYSGVVYDIMRDMGLPPAVLPHSIKSLENHVKIAGPVFTLRGRPDPSVGAHESLLEWTSFLSKAAVGHVVVCQPQDSNRALMGELSAEALKLRGVLGYLVDGGARDVSFIKKIGFPVFCRYTSPIDVVGNWRPEAMEEPVTIGNVVIHPGDYILGDEDGVVVIPKAHAEEVISRSEVAMNTESLVRKAILEGQDPQEAYVKYGKF
ncbi:methyltransferase [Devosia limi DSM 17137]|uniref:Putative 4-hydroxy-4-methyl-2-oxoglutarate aldolase n=1 Tax=Devosia limi DSM 17137 TaxID=1121477 RepID=A0A0F5LUW2_9HYPH|nr:RraA family protein [Devosia limi]KKB86061.1 methyltransferase [Devosia limi DSM 17137]SHF83851.1 Regulator of RNase E activity RraA [Devosia limi DSM 17137]